MYVDLRLGLIGDKIHGIEEARDIVAGVYGKDAAAYAARVAD